MKTGFCEILALLVFCMLIVMDIPLFGLSDAYAGGDSVMATSREPGIDRPGNDLYVISLPVPDMELCRAACDDEPLCKAYTYVKPGMQSPEALCYLKSPIPTAMANSCCTSGVKLTAEDASDRPGGDYASFIVSKNDPDRCRAACADDNRCRAYTFVKPPSGDAMAICYLKDTLPQRERNDCCVSGYRPDAVGRRQYTHEPVGGPLPPNALSPEDETDIKPIIQPLSARRQAIWPSSQIPVCWEDFDAAYANERRWVKQEVTRTWEGNSAITFQGWGQCLSNSSGIRIRVADENPRTRGLGTALDGVSGGMILNFRFQQWSPSCGSPESTREFCIRAIAVHEFGHALGFAHEQNRSDAPVWCRDQAQGTDGDVFMTPYDPDSVMNYCNTNWNNIGRLSTNDIAGLQFWYGPQPSSGIPWQPSCRTDVLLYRNANYGGRQLKIYGTMADLGVEHLNDRASSLCVPAGYRLIVYQQSQFQGANTAFDGPITIRSLHETSGGGVSNWGDTISSVKLIDLATGEEVYDAPPSCDNTPVLFADPYFRDDMVQVTHDEPALGSLKFNDRLSSVCVPEGWGIRLWQHANFRGESLDILGPSFLQQMPKGWNDRGSSLQLVPSP